MNAVIVQSPVLSDVSFVAEEYYDLSTVSSTYYPTTIKQDNSNKKYICVYGIYGGKLIVQFSGLSSERTEILFNIDYGKAPVYVGVDSYNYYLEFAARESINRMLSKFAIGTLQ